jgi:hypothetical protein
VVAALAIGVGLSAIRALAAGNGLDHFDLFAGTEVLDKVSDVDDALVAGVGALKAGVVRLYGVVVILSGSVRVGRCVEGIVGWRYPGDVHNPPYGLWAGAGGVGDTRRPDDKLLKGNVFQVRFRIFVRYAADGAEVDAITLTVL